MLRLLVCMPLIILYYYAVKKIKDWRVPPVIFALASAVALPAFCAVKDQEGEVGEMLFAVSWISIFGLLVDFWMLYKIRKEWINYNKSPYIALGHNKIQTFSEFYIDDISHNHPAY